MIHKNCVIKRWLAECYPGLCQTKIRLFPKNQKKNFVCKFHSGAITLIDVNFGTFRKITYKDGVIKVVQSVLSWLNSGEETMIFDDRNEVVRGF